MMKTKVTQVTSSRSVWSLQKTPKVSMLGGSFFDLDINEFYRTALHYNAVYIPLHEVHCHLGTSIKI